MPRACSQCGYIAPKEKKETPADAPPKVCKTCKGEYQNPKLHKKEENHLLLDKLKKGLPELSADALAFIEKMLHAKQADAPKDE
jgi:hypothetical protein